MDDRPSESKGDATGRSSPPPGMGVVATSIWRFLHTGPGMLVLGAIVTTGGGTWLNFVVQGRSQEKQRQFEIFKIMLDDSRALQNQLLTLANRRYYALRSARARIENDDYSLSEVQAFWDDRVRPLREEWNENLLLFHGRLRLLFPVTTAGPLADINLGAQFYSEEESETSSLRLDEAAANLGTDRMPKTVHGSFMATQRLVNQWLKDCKERGREECLTDARKKTVRGYVEHLGKGIADFSDNVTTRLLYMPYGTVRQE